MQAERSFSEVFLAHVEALDHGTRREVAFHHVIDSTSTDLKRRLRSGAGPGTVVAADTQETGRGRLGRTWHSSTGGNLYISLAVRVNEPFQTNLPFLPLAGGVAAADAIRVVARVEPKLKWPNDVHVSGKKIAGVLCEVPDPIRRPGIAIVGLGVNIAVSSFPEELNTTATSLALLSGGNRRDLPHPAHLAADWVTRLEQWMRRIHSKEGAELVETWRAGAEPFGRRIRVDNIEGTTVDINESGQLIAKKDDGNKVIISSGVIEFEDECI
ncbi:MAG: biotin--[acetyl-CoA-carboxylase] ligase [Deltaproteobacteria bacterium]|nr:biotin--[acetyl-CoA-carboxylase] ligase [Deltaproteobacteria bacterium]